VVVGRIDGPAGTPTLLIYGHYDVQPPGPGWTAPAFRPVRRGARLYARGTNDDKGQIYAWIAALGAWHAIGGAPCTVVIVAEGQEETGSPGLDPVLARLAARVRPSVILVSDTDATPDGTPSVTISQRGHAVLDFTVDTGGVAVHSGRFGGAVVDPSDVLARVLVEMRTILMTDPRMAATDLRRGDQMQRRVTIPDDHIRRAAGYRAITGTALHRRIGDGPAMTVLRLRAGDAHTPGAVPTTARATVDLRLPAEWKVKPVVARLTRAARACTSACGVRSLIRVNVASPAMVAVPRPFVLQALDNATFAAFGRPVRLIASGGSLPAAMALRRAFGLAPVLFGLGTSFSGAHGPNEYLDVEQWSRSVDCLIHLIGSPPQAAEIPARRRQSVDTIVI
jgi:succinyl-diaminopimelate desuccinylase